MTPNKYAALRATIARAKRHGCQKVVMRVTLAEELLDQLSNAEKQISELAAENAKPCPHCGGIGTCSEHGCTATDQILERYRASQIRKGVQS